MWVKVYSPNVTAIEVVKRAEKRARRGKLYYMRYVVVIVVAPNPPASLFILVTASGSGGSRAHEGAMK